MKYRDFECFLYMERILTENTNCNFNDKDSDLLHLTCWMPQEEVEFWTNEILSTWCEQNCNQKLDVPKHLNGKALLRMNAAKLRQCFREINFGTLVLLLDLIQYGRDCIKKGDYMSISRAIEDGLIPIGQDENNQMYVLNTFRYALIMSRREEQRTTSLMLTDSNFAANDSPGLLKELWKHIYGFLDFVSLLNASGKYPRDINDHDRNVQICKFVLQHDET